MKSPFIKWAHGSEDDIRKNYSALMKKNNTKVIDPISKGEGLVLVNFFNNDTREFFGLSFMVKGEDNPFYRRLRKDMTQIQSLPLFLKFIADGEIQTDSIKITHVESAKHIPEDHTLIIRKAIYKLEDNFKFMKSVQRQKWMINLMEGGSKIG